MNTTTYAVEGMTCGHCAAAVTREVSALDGVTAVDVNLAGGAVTVTAATPLSDDALAAAVTEAGYTLRGRI